MNIEGYKQHYTPSTFTQKMKQLSKNSAPKNLIATAVTLYVILSDSTVPFMTKSLIISSLAYLIVPFDAVPDFLIPIGLADDAVVLATTLIRVQAYDNESVQERVKEIMKDWDLA